MTFTARQYAFRILNRLDHGSRTLDAILDADSEKLPPKDRSLANTIIFGVLRYQRRLDHIIAHFSKTPFKKIDPGIKNALRIGLYQIVYLDRIPVSAAVNTTVELVKQRHPNWIVRYVNGLMRKASSENTILSDLFVENGDEKSLAVIESFPDWLIHRWVQRYGLEHTGRLCRFINTTPPITLRTNTLMIHRDRLMEQIGPEVKFLEPGAVSPDAICVNGLKRPLVEWPAFSRGLFQVQDEAAQLVTFLLDPKPGETILDACAGKGIKTGHIGQLMRNEGRITAMDIIYDKYSATGFEKEIASSLREQFVNEMTRLGIKNVVAVSHDLNRPLTGESKLVYDRILLDAPCSGLGVLRRNPDGKWRVASDQLKEMSKRQLLFLNHLAPHVKKGGRMVYSVCSMEPEENENVINAFLDTHAYFRRVSDIKNLSPYLNPLADENGYLKTCPHEDKMDGFFAVAMERIE